MDLMQKIKVIEKYYIQRKKMNKTYITVFVVAFLVALMFFAATS